MNEFYGELAPWWPLISPVEDYADEARIFRELLEEKRPQARELLELGSGGGHVAYYLKERFHCTLSDLSPAMLAVSATLNPTCAHVVGDMRELDLGRPFDLVFVHDAIDYMASEEDLRAAMATAFRHLRPGGLALFVPDRFLETYEPGTESGGSDGADGRAARYLEWNEALDASSGEVLTHYCFVLREADGKLWNRLETHRFRLFSQQTWERLLAEVGFEVESVVEPPNGEHEPRVLLLGHKMAGENRE